MRAVKVRKEEAERVRRELAEGGWLDRRYRVLRDDEHVYFPVISNTPYPTVEVDAEILENRLHPAERVRMRLSSLPEWARELVPDCWDRVGDVLLLKMPLELKPYAREIGRAFAEVLRVKAVLWDMGVEGELREPKVRFIHGSDAVTIHREHGIAYMLDASRIMFSSGNVEERKRMATIRAKGEVIVDMFAGIGYFTLPLALHSGARKIYACEKNPLAYGYLVKNVELNNVAHIVVPLQGDNREVAPRGVADRVVMGYVRTEGFLPVAMEVLREEGGVVHYHTTAREEEIWDGVLSTLRMAGEERGFEMEVLYRKRVKSYAPRVWHVVVDARFYRP